MSGLLWVSRRARPCDVSALGDRNGAADTASEAARPEHSGGPRRRENLTAQRPRGGRLTGSGFAWPEINLPAGEILAPQKLAAATAGSSGHRDMQGRGCRTPTGSRLADHSLKGSSTQSSPDLASGSPEPCSAVSRGRYGSQSVKAQRSGGRIKAGRTLARESVISGDTITPRHRDRDPPYGRLGVCRLSMLDARQHGR